MIKNKKTRRILVKYIKKYTLHWYAVTALLYLSLVPVTIWVFPATTLGLTLILLLTGFTAAMGSFASALVAQEQDDILKEESDAGQDQD